MSKNSPGASGATKGRAVGFVALGALLALIGIAFYSSQSARDAATPESPAAAPAPPAGPTAPADPADLSRAPRVTEALPDVRSKGGIVTAVLEDIALSPPARLLAERFKCVCGCEDILVACHCEKTPGSRDMKRYLQELVDAGKKPSEIESAMVARYGESALP